jgi:hypothetical protein
MGMRAHSISLTVMSASTMWVTRFRMRREDRCSMPCSFLSQTSAGKHQRRIMCVCFPSSCLVLLRWPFLRSLIAPPDASTIFLLRPFPLFDRAAGFPSPRPQDALADARRTCRGWPLFSGHRQARPLHDRARRRTPGFGASASIASGCVARGRGSLPGSPFSSRSSRARRIMDLRKLRCRYVPNGVTNVLPKESRGRRGPSRQGRSFALAANENALLKRLLPHATTGTSGW